MKKYSIIVLILSVMVSFVSCDKETEGVSRITYYTDLSIKGSDVVVITKGNAYVEPGFVAKENGVDVSSQVKIDGEVKSDVVGAYNLTYVAVNKDGFEKQVSRLVLVVPTSLSNEDLTGLYSGQRTGKAKSLKACNITKLADGVFFADDLFGGYYNIVAKYGAAYRLPTYFYLNADNTYVGLSNTSPWGAWDIVSGVYTPSSKKLVHKVQQGGFSFQVTLINE